MRRPMGDVMVAVLATLVVFGWARSPGGTTLAGGERGSEFARVAAITGAAATAAFGATAIVVVPSAGSLETLERMLAGDVDLGLASASDTYLAHRGLDAFDVDEQPAHGVRALGALYRVEARLLVAAGSDVRSLADLAGRRLAVGPSGSGDAVTAERVLRQAGLLGSVLPVFAGGTEAIRLLASGRVDAIHALVPPGDELFAPLVAAGDLEVVATTADLAAAGLFDRFPFYAPEGWRSEARVAPSAGLEWGDVVLWVARAGVDVETVYDFTRIAFGVAADAGDGSGGRVGSGSLQTLQEPLTAVDVPLHPGAARYWSERGYPIPDAALPLDPTR